MPLPRFLSAFRRARTTEPARPAEFIAPVSVSKHFDSMDDRAELSRIKQERRDALTKLRHSSRASWRNTP